MLRSRFEYAIVRRIRSGTAFVSVCSPLVARLRKVSLFQVTPELSVLLASVGRGDRAAFKTLYDRTSAKLLGVALRIVRDRTLAEEVLQESYLRIWQKAATYEPAAGKPMSWMIAIVRYRGIDVARQRTEVLLAPDEDGRDWLDMVPGTDDQEATLIDRDRLERCLGLLEAPQRDCIVLAYCSGYSREELSARFERPVNTIKTWLHRALGALQSCLDAP